MDYKEVIRLVYNVKKATDEAKEAFDHLKEQSIILEEYAERIRMEQRTDIEKWLEETFPILFQLERANVGQMGGYEHYSIVNDRIKMENFTWLIEELERPLDVIQAAFIDTVTNVIEKPLADGRKILVRIPPEYSMTEEGYHRFRCRLLIEKVN